MAAVVTDSNIVCHDDGGGSDLRIENGGASHEDGGVATRHEACLKPTFVKDKPVGRVVPWASRAAGVALTAGGLIRQNPQNCFQFRSVRLSSCGRAVWCRGAIRGRHI